MRIPHFVFVSNLAPLYGRDRGRGLFRFGRAVSPQAVCRGSCSSMSTRVRNLCLSGVRLLTGRRSRAGASDLVSRSTTSPRSGDDKGLGAMTCALPFSGLRARPIRGECACA
jgi:hypothetical protein